MNKLAALWMSALCICMAAAANEASAQQRGRMIVNQLSNKCIDVSGAPGAQNGAMLQLWDCETSGRNTNGSASDQFWEFTNGGFIRNTLSGKCIDVSGAPGLRNGARLQLWDCETSGRNANGTPTDQLWTLRPDGFIVNKLSAKCIDVSGAPGARNGAPLQLWDCENSGRNRDNGSATDQRWRLTNVAALLPPPPRQAAPQIAQAPAADPFDKPISVQKLPKKPDSDVEVRCTYYSDLMIRETMDGPTSTDAVIVRGARPPCSDGKVAGKIAAKTADHALLGRKGPFLVFSYMDPHGAVPFVVVDSGSGRAVFADATVGNPEIWTAAIESGALRLRYRRGINADCSIMQDAPGCWAKLVKAGKIPAVMAQQVPSPRICDAAYKGAKSPPDNTSIVGYDTEMRIDATGTAQVLATGPLACDAQS